MSISVTKTHVCISSKPLPPPKKSSTSILWVLSFLVKMQPIWPQTFNYNLWFQFEMERKGKKPWTLPDYPFPFVCCCCCRCCVFFPFTSLIIISSVMAVAPATSYSNKLLLHWRHGVDDGFDRNMVSCPPNITIKSALTTINKNVQLIIY